MICKIILLHTLCIHCFWSKTRIPIVNLWWNDWPENFNGTKYATPISRQIKNFAMENLSGEKFGGCNWLASKALKSFWFSHGESVTYIDRVRLKCHLWKILQAIIPFIYFRGVGNSAEGMDKSRPPLSCIPFNLKIICENVSSIIFWSS